MKKILSQSPSYEVELPEQIESQHDGRVSSFWLDGEPLLLQISSYIRTAGQQVSAVERLEDRMAKTSGKRNDVHVYVNSHAPDQAAAEVLDSNEITWLHSYLVWPHLALYVTISGPEAEVHEEKSWARSALKSIALRVH